MPKDKWYTRRGHEVRGPFPATEIQKQLLLGRLNPDDYISPDQRRWQRITTKPDLIPVELTLDLQDTDNLARLQSAQVALDERSMNDRRKGNSESTLRSGDDRREKLSSGQTGRSSIMSLIAGHPRDNAFFYFIVFGFVTGCVAILGIFMSMKAPSKTLDCLKPPAPGVNWSYCVFQTLKLPEYNLTGAKLKYGIFRNANLSDSILSKANLSFSNLYGADFTNAHLDHSHLENAILQQADFSGADLHNANLRHSVLKEADFSNTNLNGADLSGAVLIGANMGTANLKDANLSGAIWVDARICAEQSIGVCLTN